MKPTTKRQGQRSTGTLQLRPPPTSSCTASDATSTRSFTTSTWPLAAANCNGVQPRAAHAAETFLAEVEERVTTETGIERSSPDGHRPQRPRAIVLLHVHLGLGLEQQLDHLRAALECRPVQRGRASVRSPACGCASRHLPLRSSVPSCWSRCLLQGLFRCKFDRIMIMAKVHTS